MRPQNAEAASLYKRMVKIGNITPFASSCSLELDNVDGLLGYGLNFGALAGASPLGGLFVSACS